jgi:hypothetical protein
VEELGSRRETGKLPCLTLISHHGLDLTVLKRFLDLGEADKARYAKEVSSL